MIALASPTHTMHAAAIAIRQPMGCATNEAPIRPWAASDTAVVIPQVGHGL